MKRTLIFAGLVVIIAVACTAQTISMDDSDPDSPKLSQGKTPAKIVVEKVIPYPTPGSPNVIVLRNIGGQTANLTGYRLTDSDTRSVAAANNYVFGADPMCAGGNVTIVPTGTLTLRPKNDTNLCGFSFGVAFRDEVNLFDPNGTLITSAKWSNSSPGAAIHLLPDGTYKLVPEDKNILDTLIALGGYKSFVEALKATGLDKALLAASDPAYAGAPKTPTIIVKAVTPQFPWWFGFGTDRSKLPPPAPPPERAAPPPAGIPLKGPFTVLAPTDEAFSSLLMGLGGAKKLPLDQFYALPELKDILIYHILAGYYTSDLLFNNTPIYTSMAVDIVPFTDPAMTEGALMLNDNCVDKPTPDNYTCYEQVGFDKCYFPFMTSALAAQWQGGFCQRTCQRCSCSPDSGAQCAVVVLPDVKASNGIIQGVSRVMFPPPKFTKAMYGNITIDITNVTAIAAVPVKVVNATKAPTTPAVILTAPKAAPVPAPVKAPSPASSPSDSADPAPEASSPSDGTSQGSTVIKAQG